MKERDTPTAGAGPNPGRDDFGAARLRPLEGEIEVGDADTQVMDPRSTTGQETRDRRVLAQRGQQFDPSGVFPEEGDADPLAGHGLRPCRLRAQQFRPALRGLFKRVDRNSDVIDYGHLADVFAVVHSAGNPLLYSLWWMAWGESPRFGSTPGNVFEEQHRSQRRPAISRGPSTVITW